MVWLITTWKFIVKYKSIIFIALFGLLGLFAYNMYNKMIQYKNDYKRTTDNYSKLNQELSIEKSKSGNLIYSVQSLMLTTDELKRLNTGIINELSDMKLKLKNTQSITDVKYSVEKIYDTIHSEKPIVFENVKGKELQYNFISDKDSVTIKGKINVPVKNELNYGYYALDNSMQPYLTGTTFNYNGRLIIANEIQYKRHWIFWRKATGVKIHIKSDNDVFKINQLETINIVK